jgi:ParB family chromosome partitioning protein
MTTVTAEATSLVAIDRIHPNPDQPRRWFDENTLEELTSSIRQFGILQPLIVRPLGEGYQLVAGERRWRAAASTPEQRL